MAKQILKEVKAIADEYEKNVDDIKRYLPAADVMVTKYQIMFENDSIFVKIGSKVFAQKGTTPVIDEAFAFICVGPTCTFDLKNVTTIPIEIVAVMCERKLEIGFAHNGMVYAFKSDDDGKASRMCKILFFTKKMRDSIGKRVDESFIKSNSIAYDPTLPVLDANLYWNVCQYENYILVDGKKSYEFYEYAPMRLAHHVSYKEFEQCEPSGAAKFTLARKSSSKEMYICIKVDGTYVPVTILGSPMRHFTELSAIVRLLEQEYVEK